MLLCSETDRRSAIGMEQNAGALRHAFESVCVFFFTSHEWAQMVLLSCERERVNIEVWIFLI